MTPEPYRSDWCDRIHYLVRTAVDGSAGPLYVIVTDGVQPADGLRFPGRTDATGWLRDNGFVPVSAAPIA